MPKREDGISFKNRYFINNLAVYLELINFWCGFFVQALSGCLSMEAYVALHQADELQGIISEIKVSEQIIFLAWL